MNKSIKKVCRYVYYLPSNFLNKIQYKIKGVQVGRFHETKGLLYIKNHGTIIIGDNVRINSKDTANPIGASVRTYFQILNNGKLEIGNRTRISNCAITSASQVTIGDDVRIGAGVKIYDTDFHSLNPTDRTTDSTTDIAKSTPIFIDDCAFIGASSHILKGVTIGKAAVIGAASVVTKNIPPYEIWAGNPAKKVGEVEHK